MKATSTIATSTAPAAISAAATAREELRTGFTARRTMSDHQPTEDRSVTLPGVRVVIGEDHALMREGLRLVLERAGFEIDAVAEDAPGLRREVVARRPDLVVADISMPPQFADDGLRTVLELRARRP